MVEHINKDRYRQMSQVEQWLQANKDQLAEIVRRSDASPDLVHLVAVLVLGGLTDAQIHKQLGLVESRFDSDHGYVEHVLRALPEIRSIAVDAGFPTPVPQ